MKIYSKFDIKCIIVALNYQMLISFKRKNLFQVHFKNVFNTYKVGHHKKI